jgi:PAS domain S-box-containing protein
LLLAPLPFLLLAATRTGVAGTCLSLLALGEAIIVQALNEQGPFAVHASFERVISLQVFLIAISAPLILLAALVEDRRRTERLLTDSEARMKVVAASTDTGLWQWDETRQSLWTTEHCRTMLGIEQGETLTPDAFLDTVHEDDRERVRAALTRMLTSAGVEVLDEFRVVRNGELRWFIVRSHTELDAGGRAVRVSGVARDITSRIVAQHQAKALAHRLLALQEEERRSIGMDLHESASQDLVAVGLNLRALRRRLTLSDAAGVAMDEILTYLNQATNELRTLSFLLRPEGLQGEGLCAVLQRYIEGFKRRTGLGATLRTNPVADRVPLDQQRAMLRIVQESLTGMHRHGGAERVSVDLRCIADALHVDVVTKGAVMDQASEQRLRDSFEGMTARIELFKGKMAIRSRPEGATVHAAIPLGSEGTARTASAG